MDRHDHLDPAMIASLVDQTLDPAARAAAEAHLAECADCREVWVETIEMASETRGATTSETSRDAVASARPRSRRSWIYAAAGLAAAAALAVAVLSPRLFDRKSDLQTLVDAVGENRRTEARLTGGFKWGPVPSVTRAGDTETKVSAETQIAIARLQQQVERNRNADTLAAFGTANLIAGRHDAAIDALDEAVAIDPNHAAAWSDLGAALLSRSAFAGREADVPRAAEAAATAIRHNPELAEAYFNHALALERMGLRAEAKTAWEEFLRRDSASRWSEEARRHLQALAQSPASGTRDLQRQRERFFDELLPSVVTGRRLASAEAQRAAESIDVAHDTLPQSALSATLRSLNGVRSSTVVSRGLIAYKEGREAYRREDFDAAALRFATAESSLAEVEHPVALLATLHRGLVDYRLRRMERARQVFEGLQPRARDSASLAGRIKWMLGLIAVHQGDHRAASEHYATAVQKLEAAQEAANAGFVQGLMATSLELSGRSTESWTPRLKALTTSDREGTLLQAASVAIDSGWLHVAAALQRTALSHARAANRQTGVVDSLRHLALTEGLRGLKAQSEALFDEARTLASRLPTDTRDRLVAEMTIAEAAAGAARPDLITDADRAIAYFTEAGLPARIPEVRLAMARVYRRLGNRDRAGEQLLSGIAEYNALRAGIQLGSGAVAFTDVVRRLIDEQMALEIEQGRTDRALKALLDLKRPGVASAGSREATTFIAAALSGGQLLTWGVRGPRTEFKAQRVSVSEVARLVTNAGPPRFDRYAAARLRALLITPFESLLQAGDAVLLLPDGPLHLVSLAALPGAKQEYMIEEHAVAMAASTSERPRRGPVAAEQALIVANPPIHPDLRTRLSALPSADQEARAVASAYNAPIAVAGASATAERILQELRGATMFHYAGHALVNGVSAGDSLLAAAGHERQGITADEIARLRLPNLGLVVLAACESVDGLMTRSEGPMGLARAFLVAGAQTVIGTQWVLDDNASLELFRGFHHRYAGGESSVSALRAAQLELLRGADARLRTPWAWAAPVAIVGF